MSVEEYTEDEEDEEDEDQDEEAPEVIDFSNWEKASYEDLAILRVPQEPTKVKVPIDPVKKKYVILAIQELTIEDQLRLMEDFFSVDSKSKSVKFNLLAYYKTTWIKTVKGSDPRITWKQAKYYGKRFLQILMDYLPNPFDLLDEGPAGLTELETKNLEQPSEERQSST